MRRINLSEKLDRTTTPTTSSSFSEETRRSSYAIETSSFTWATSTSPPRGVEHCPRAEEEASVLLIEPSGTVNTGDACGPRALTYVALSALRKVVIP